MEESDTEGQPDTHDPEFDARRHQGSVDVPQLHSNPVHVEEDDGTKGKRQATDTQHRHASVEVEEEHASDEDQRPEDGEADEEGAESID